jgi:hypothetical protein
MGIVQEGNARRPLQRISSDGSALVGVKTMVKRKSFVMSAIEAVSGHRKTTSHSYFSKKNEDAETSAHDATVRHHRRSGSVVSMLGDNVESIGISVNKFKAVR